MSSAGTALRRFVLFGIGATLMCVGAGVALLSFVSEGAWFSTAGALLVLMAVLGVFLTGYTAWTLQRLNRDAVAGSVTNGNDSAEYQFRRLLETMELIPWEADIHTWQFRYVGPQAAKLLGYPVEDWYAEGFWIEKMFPADRAEFESALRQAFVQRASLQLTHRMVRQDGQVIWVQDFIAIPKTRSGTYLFRGCLVDITGRKRIEDQLRQNEKMQAISRVAGSAAHDFNNVLLAIGGYAETLRRQPLLSLSMRQEVEDILKAVDQARILVRELLAFEDLPPHAAQRLHLGSLLKRMERMLGALLDESIKFSIDTGQTRAWVEADPVELERAIVNLVVNARDAMPQGGTLTITVEDVANGQAAQIGTHVKLSVCDTGEGMPDEVRKRIFEPFYTTKGAAGTGLGLYGVYGLVKKYRGHIEVLSTPGQGTTFEIRLPCILGEVTPYGLAREGPTLSARQRRETAMSGTPPTILVVDDERFVRPVYRRMLESVGYNVLEAADGSDALQTIEQHTGPIDLMVTDVVMPQLNGFELARQVKQQRPDMKVLYVTGFIDVKEMSRQQGISLDTLLQKPFMPETLVKKVRELLASN